MSDYAVRASAVLVAACAALGGLGCGGGAALMHPAHVLPPNRVTMGAGVSNNFVLGRARRAIDAGHAATAAGTAQTTQTATLARDGAFADMLVTPGLAPWVGARAGLGYSTDAGLTYTARSVRVDGRYALENQSTAVSFGLGGSALLRRVSEDTATVQQGNEAQGIDLSNGSGFGIDVPIIAGWRSDAELFQVYGGARGGYEAIRGDIVTLVATGLAPPDDFRTEQTTFHANRFYIGGLAGLAVGVRPLWVVVEIDAAYQRLTGDLGVANAPVTRLDGVALAPTGAVVGKF